MTHMIIPAVAFVLVGLGTAQAAPRKPNPQGGWSNAPVRLQGPENGPASAQQHCMLQRVRDDSAACSQPLRDLFQHHLGGAAADGQHAGVAHHPLDRGAAHEAGAAVQLQAAVHDLVQDFRR